MSRSSFVVRIARFEHLVVPALYTLFALVMSFPLAAQFGDHIAGIDGDVWSYLWAMGWARVSVLNLGVNPFHSDYVFYPLGGATQLLWGTALPSFASIPLQLAFGLVPAFNLIYLAATVLTAYGMYLLAQDVFTNDACPLSHPSALRPSSFVLRPSVAPPSSIVLRPSSIRLASFLTGLVFAFSALRLGYGIAFTNLFHTEFIPFYVLYLLRATRNAGWKNAVLAGFFFALNVYIDFQLAAFLALLTGLWGLYVFVQDPKGLIQNPSGLLARAFVQDPKGLLRVRNELGARVKNPSGLVARWLAMFAVAGILSLPMLAFVLQDFSIEGGNYIRVYPLRYSADRSYDALAFVSPNARSTLYQDFFPRVPGTDAPINADDNSVLSPDRQSFLGATVLILALAGAIWFRRVMIFWILVAVVFFVLSLGPVLHLFGDSTNLPLPFAWLNQVPIVNHIRIPMRYGLVVFFAVALLAGAGGAILLEWQKWLIAPLVAFVLIEAAVLPYPTLEFRVPPVYEQIARDPDDVTVLEIPSFNWRFAARNETYQVIHQKRILRAYTNRIAPDLAEYFGLRQTPIVVRTLRILEGAERGILTREELDQDEAARAQTLAFFNLRYIVLHRDQLDAARVSQIDQYLRDVLNADAFYHNDQVTAYQIANPTNVPALDADFSNNAGLMLLGRGWQMEPLADVDDERGRFAKRGQSEIYFRGGALRGNKLALSVLNQNNSASLSFSLNGQLFASTVLENSWQTILLELPQSTAPQMNLLKMESNELPNTIAVGSIENP